MKKTMLLSFALMISLLIHSQINLDYFLPKDINYNKDIPAPAQFFGHEVGEWHLTHDKLVNYLLELARVSDRAIWEEYARSYEDRPLGQLIISSPENIRKLEQLRQEHLKLCDPAVSGSMDLKNMPLFVKLGYGVHGNESSAQNASVLTAYYLISGEGEKINQLLGNTIILIDPSLNPDGMQRHSTWVNATRSLNNNPDPDSWEFNEPWPGGRTNHYWFDLNRDYILLRQPESVGRVAEFFRWRPNINTDHHEMGANATFFFQPGVQSRNNPLTPENNQELTAEIGKYHEKFLNDIGSLYFTEESYDDFYVGKGSSYPDIHGSIGILFEQAGVKGHLKSTPGGLLSFPFAIRNQFTVSLSTLEAGLNMRLKLLEELRDFYKDAAVQAEKFPVKGYVFTESSDKYRINEFVNNLLQHKIKVYKLSGDFSKNGVQYTAKDSYVVPMKQNEYRFARSLFEPVKVFTDSVFYDVSTWNLPMMFNIKYTGISAPKELEVIQGEEVINLPAAEGKLLSAQNAYAYLFEWNEYLAPGALYELQAAGINARVSTDKFTVDDGTLKKEFGYGTILIPASVQSMNGKELFTMMDSVAKKFRITIYGVNTGMTTRGIDLGSSEFSVLKKPVALMFVGDGAVSSDAGEIWHMFDTRYKIPVTMVTDRQFNNLDLDKYNVLIITGSPSISPGAIENIRSWNKRGGTIIAYESGNSWLAKNKLAEIEINPAAESNVKEGKYMNRKGDAQVQQIPGSIFETILDLSHPLCYGYTNDRLPVFKSTAGSASKDKGVYNNPVVYSSDPLLSGYCSKENIAKIKGSVFAGVHGSRIISIYDNTNFRAITYGTNKIFMNAVFFGQIL